jgi:hypothetical protein
MDIPKTNPEISSERKTTTSTPPEATGLCGCWGRNGPSLNGPTSWWNIILGEILKVYGKFANSYDSYTEPHLSACKQIRTQPSREVGNIGKETSDGTKQHHIVQCYSHISPIRSHLLRRGVGFDLVADNPHWKQLLVVYWNETRTGKWWGGGRRRVLEVRQSFMFAQQL